MDDESDVWTRLEEITAALATRVAGTGSIDSPVEGPVEGGELPDGDELHRALVAVQRCRHQLGAVAAMLADGWDTQKVWASDGSRSAASRLSRDVHCSPQWAATELRRARKLRRMPTARRAALDGTISLDHVDVLASDAQEPWQATFEQHEPMLVEFCHDMLFTDFHTVVQYWKHAADATATEIDATATTDAAKVFLSTTLDGTVTLHGTLDAVRGDIVSREIDRLSRALEHSDRRAGVTRTPAQRRADALVNMAKRSARATGRRRNRPLITVVMGERAFHSTCELASGVVLTPGQVVPLLADADIETILFDAEHRPVAASRQRTFSGALRRAIAAHGRHCTHPSGRPTRPIGPRLGCAHGHRNRRHGRTAPGDDPQPVRQRRHRDLGARDAQRRPARAFSGGHRARRPTVRVAAGSWVGGGAHRGQ